MYDDIFIFIITNADNSFIIYLSKYLYLNHNKITKS